MSECAYSFFFFSVSTWFGTAQEKLKSHLLRKLVGYAHLDQDASQPARPIDGDIAELEGELMHWLEEDFQSSLHGLSLMHSYSHVPGCAVRSLVEADHFFACTDDLCVLFVTSPRSCMRRDTKPMRASAPEKIV